MLTRVWLRLAAPSSSSKNGSRPCVKPLHVHAKAQLLQHYLGVPNSKQVCKVSQHPPVSR